MSRRDLAQLLDYAGALEAILCARARSVCPWITVLTYHRIHDDPAGQPFDMGVIDATSGEFDQQLSVLKRYFNVVSLDDVLAYVSGKPLPPNPALITFDDGYRDCYVRALPILLKHGLPASFFIATSYINERRVFWWDRISYAVRSAAPGRYVLTYPETMELDLALERAKVLSTLLRIPKRYYNLNVERFLTELANTLGVPWNEELERQHAESLIMTWDEIRGLRRAGMQVHSHTRTHRVLQTLPPKQLASELMGARKDLEEQLGEPIQAVSYPVGKSIASCPSIRAAVQDAGYKVGFSNGSGVTWTLGRFDPFDMKRISVELNLPASYFRALLAIPTFAEKPGC